MKCCEYDLVILTSLYKPVQLNWFISIIILMKRSAVAVHPSQLEFLASRFFENVINLFLNCHVRSPPNKPVRWTLQPYHPILILAIKVEAYPSGARNAAPAMGGTREY
jgi:hypothetical protein